MISNYLPVSVSRRANEDADPEAYMEMSLYVPVKNFLECLGYTVMGKIGHCDLVGLRDDEQTVVVIREPKLTSNLELILQAWTVSSQTGVLASRIVPLCALPVRK